MKITSWSIVFIIIIFAFSFVNRVEISNKMQIMQTEVRYNNAIDEATIDGTKKLMQQIQNLNRQTDMTAYMLLSSCDAFFDSFALSMGYFGGESLQTTLSRYIPAISIIGFDGLYIFSMEEIKNGTGYNMEHTLKPKIPYTVMDEYKIIENGIEKKPDEVIVTYSLDQTVEVIKEVQINPSGELGEYVNEGGILKLKGNIVDVRHYNDIYITPENYPTRAWTANEILADGTVMPFHYNVTDDGIYTKESINTYKGKYLKYMKYLYITYLEEQFLYEEWYTKEPDGAYEAIYRSVTPYSDEDYLFTMLLRGVDDVYAIPNNYLTEGSPEIKGMIDPFTGEYIVGEYNRIKNKIITDLLIDKLTAYITIHNVFARANNINYTFIIPDIQSSEWDRAIEDISMFAFVQGLPMLGNVYYNNYGLSGAKIVKKQLFYAFPNTGRDIDYSSTPEKFQEDYDAFPVYYSSYKYNDSDKYLLESNGANIFYSGQEAAMNGFFPDLNSQKDTLLEIQNNIFEMTVLVKEVLAEGETEESNRENGYIRYEYTVSGKYGAEYNIQVVNASYFVHNTGSGNYESANYILANGFEVSNNYNYEAGKGQFTINKNGDYLFAVRERGGSTARTANLIKATGINERGFSIVLEQSYIPASRSAVIYIVGLGERAFGSIVITDPEGNTQNVDSNMIYYNDFNHDGTNDAIIDYIVTVNGTYSVVANNEYNNEMDTKTINVDCIQNQPPTVPKIAIKDLQMKETDTIIAYGYSATVYISVNSSSDPEGDQIYYDFQISKDGGEYQTYVREEPYTELMLVPGTYIVRARAYDIVDGVPDEYSAYETKIFNVITY